MELRLTFATTRLRDSGPSRGGRKTYNICDGCLRQSSFRPTAGWAQGALPPRCRLNKVAKDAKAAPHIASCIKGRGPALIPEHLNTYVVGGYIIEPTVGLERSSGNVVIVARVSEIATNKPLTSGVFESEAEYEAFVEKVISDWPK